MGREVPESVVQFFKAAGWRRPPIRSSAMGTYDLCPRKFLFEEKLGLKPKGYESSKTRGDLYHEFRRGHILGLSESDIESTVQGKVHAEQKRLTEDAGKNGILPNGQSLSKVLQELQDDLAVARAMALAFSARHPFDSSRWKIMGAPDGTPLTEKLFSIQLPGIKTLVKVKFDNVLIDGQSGAYDGTTHTEPQSVWIIDDKTTKLDPRAKATSMSFSNQIALYRLVLELMIEEWGWQDRYKVVGSVHNVLKVPTIKFCSKDACFEDYVERVKKWYNEQSPDPIIQLWTRFGGERLPSEFAFRLSEQDRVSGALPTLAKFPRRESSCFQYNKTCPFLSLCTTDLATWPSIVEASLVRRFRDDDPESQE